MKNKITNILTLMIFAFAILSCSTSDDSTDDNTSGNTTVEQTENIAQNGSWKITYFWDTDHEETSNFSGYSFSFNTDGTLVATNGSAPPVNGTWSVTSGSSSSDDDDHFNIFFASPDDFEELSDDWEIVSISSSKIELTDVSGGNGGTDFLTFEKI